MPRVLVIEDAEATQRLIEMTLLLDGCDVEVVDTGEAGVAAARRETPDLLVLDIALPGMDGWETLRTIRSDPAAESVPVIVVTAHDPGGTRNSGHIDEADAFLAKPFNIDALRKLVNEQLDAGVVS